MCGILYFENEYGIREEISEVNSLQEARYIMRDRLEAMNIEPPYIREFKTNSGCTKFDFGSQWEYFVYEE